MDEKPSKSKSKSSTAKTLKAEVTTLGDISALSNLKKELEENEKDEDKK